MKIDDYKIVFIIIGLIGVLLISSPAFAEFISAPQGEPFSELYVLGSGHMLEDYPYNVAVNQNNSIYVGVRNHLGSSTYYVLYLKLLNQTDSLPNSTTVTGSPVQPLYEYRFAIQNDQEWEKMLTFSITNGTSNNDQSIIRELAINDAVLDINKSALWNANVTGYPYRLLIELWNYDDQSQIIEYHERYLSLNLNFTSSNIS